MIDTYIILIGPICEKVHEGYKKNWNILYCKIWKYFGKFCKYKIKSRLILSDKVSKSFAFTFWAWNSTVVLLVFYETSTIRSTFENNTADVTSLSLQINRAHLTYFWVSVRIDYFDMTGKISLVIYTTCYFGK